MEKNYKYLILTICFSFLFPACTTVKSTPSGFLSDYSTFRAVKGNKKLLLDFTGYNQLDKYKKVIIKPVEIYFQPNSLRKKINPEQLKKLASLFREQLEYNLKSKYLIVTEPADDVMILRTAITDVIPNTFYMNLHASSYILFAPGVGGSAMEAEFIDSLNGKRIMGIIDSRKGKKYKYHRSLTKWGHVKDILNQWALLLTSDENNFKFDQ